MTKDRCFDIGLVMAGAVSGGAYSAGIVDFLIEALDAWEAAKEAETAAGRAPQDWSVPSHSVCLKVMTGTSAGAMNTALATVAVNETFHHVHNVPAPAAAAADNKLYRAWVVEVDISKMLTDSDLADDAPVRSLLNSDALTRIAEESIRFKPREKRRSYVAPNLKVFLAVTNLRGVPYAIPFAGGPAHGMSMHADVMEFSLVDEIDKTLEAKKKAKNTAIPLPAKDPSHSNWKILATSALASGAFPIGLRSRLLQRESAYYGKRLWPIPTAGDKDEQGNCLCTVEKPMPPNWSATDVGDDFAFLNVDGGVINNEPFELARKELAGGWDKRNPREPEKADRAVIMVDPFPNISTFDPNYVPKDDLISVATGLVNAAIQNARFKTDELALVEPDNNVFSRFIIAPSADGMGSSAPPLIAGSLGAFGGFFLRRFREYDYMLGRRNCQQFLRRYFVLRDDNPIFHDWNPALKKNPDLAVKRDGDAAVYHPIIPLLPLTGAGASTGAANLRAEIKLPPRPRITEAELATIRRSVESRVKAVGRRVLEKSGPAGPVGWGLRCAWDWLLSKRAAAKADAWIRDGFAKWDLLE